jgi:hypothetical protein
MDDCDKESRGRGLCGTHWLRWRKYGDPTVVKRPGIDYMTKVPCSVDDCDRLAHAHGFCGLHLRRWEKHGDPAVVGERNGRPLKGDVPTWAAVHKRLSRDRGLASGFRCVDCGAPAQEWSYDGADPDELIGQVGEFRLPYSLDLSHYDPRCVSCHRKYDHAGNRPRGASGQFEKVRFAGQEGK